MEFQSTLTSWCNSSARVLAKAAAAFSGASCGHRLLNAVATMASSLCVGGTTLNSLNSAVMRSSAIFKHKILSPFLPSSSCSSQRKRKREHGYSSGTSCQSSKTHLLLMWATAARHADINGCSSMKIWSQSKTANSTHSNGVQSSVEVRSIRGQALLEVLPSTVDVKTVHQAGSESGVQASTQRITAVHSTFSETRSNKCTRFDVPTRGDHSSHRTCATIGTGESSALVRGTTPDTGQVRSGQVSEVT